MSVVQACADAEAVIRRARALFGSSGSSEVPSGADQLHDATDGIGQARQRAGEMSGEGVSGYRELAEQAIPPLHTAAGSDTSLAGRISAAAAVDQAGAQRLDTIAANTQTLAAAAPSATSPNQQRAILTALKAQLQQAQQVVKTTQQHGDSTAGQLQTLTYPKDTPAHRDGEIQALDHDIPLDPPPQDPGYSAHPTWRYTDQDLYTHEPTAGDIRQDGIGDCYLDSTMGAIAGANPQWIRDRIQFDDATGQFNVTLWDGQTWRNIAVTQDDITTDIAHHGASWRDNGLPQAALWPSVLESAYAKFHSPELSFPHALDSGIDGGQGRDAMQALTGNQGVNIDPQTVWRTNEHIDQDISRALANHQPITISTGPNGGPLMSDHSYIVEGITGTGSDAQVVMRNPWASNPRDPNNPLITARLGDLIGSGLTGKLEKFGTHPVYDINIGSLG